MNGKLKMENGKLKEVSSEELVVSSDFVTKQPNLTNQPYNNSIPETLDLTFLTIKIIFHFQFSIFNLLKQKTKKEVAKWNY